MRGRVHIRPVLDLDSLGGTIGQSPELPLNVTLGDCDFAESSMQVASRRRTGSMGVPPSMRKGSISSLERRDRVFVTFFETEVVSLGKEAGRAEPFFVCWDCRKWRV